MFRTVGGGVLWFHYWEKWYPATAEEVDGGPHVAATAEFHGCEEFHMVMWVLPTFRS